MASTIPPRFLSLHIFGMLTAARLPFYTTAYLDDFALASKFIVKTPRLLLVPASWNDEEHYVRLLVDPETMAFYEDGVTYDRDRSEYRLTEWVGRWQSGDPFSALSIFIKRCPGAKRRRTGACDNITSEFIGFAALDPSSQAGSAELVYVIDRRHWNHGYGEEAIHAVVCEFARSLKSRSYTLDGRAFTGICASPRTDHTRAVQKLRSLGFEERGVTIRHGYLRYIYYREI